VAPKTYHKTQNQFHQLTIFSGSLQARPEPSASIASLMMGLASLTHHHITSYSSINRQVRMVSISAQHITACGCFTVSQQQEAQHPLTIFSGSL
jgi:hypothetical protein